MNVGVKDMDFLYVFIIPDRPLSKMQAENFSTQGSEIANVPLKENLRKKSAHAHIKSHSSSRIGKEIKGTDTNII